MPYVGIVVFGGDEPEGTGELVGFAPSEFFDRPGGRAEFDLFAQQTLAGGWSQWSWDVDVSPADVGLPATRDAPAVITAVGLELGLPLNDYLERFIPSDESPGSIISVRNVDQMFPLLRAVTEASPLAQFCGRHGSKRDPTCEFC